MRILRVHGGEPKYYHALIGGNFRLDELQAAVLRIKLEHLDDWTTARQRNAAHYDELHRSPRGSGTTSVVPFRTPGYRHIFNQYVIRARASRRASRPSRGAAASAPRSTTRCRCTSSSASHISVIDPSDFPEAHRAAAEVLALPIYPELRRSSSSTSSSRSPASIASRDA